MLCPKCKSLTDVGIYACTSCGSVPPDIDKSIRGNDFDKALLKTAIKFAGIGSQIIREDEEWGFACKPLTDSEMAIPFFLRLITIDDEDQNNMYQNRVFYRTQLSMRDINVNEAFMKVIDKTNSSQCFIRLDLDGSSDDADITAILHLPTFFSVRDLMNFIEWCILETAILFDTANKFMK